MALLFPKIRKRPVKSRTILTLLRFREVLNMKTEERSRHTVWMEDTVWQRVQEHYKSDSSINDFLLSCACKTNDTHTQSYQYFLHILHNYCLFNQYRFCRIKGFSLKSILLFIKKKAPSIQSCCVTV